MRNHRTVSRYHLARPITGHIEHDEVRYPGDIMEFSTAGFRMRVHNVSKEAFSSSTDAFHFAEFIYKQNEISGFGEVRHVQAVGEDLLLGFKWDDFHANENIHKSFAIISDLVSDGVAGCVNVGDGVVELIGHVSSALADDLQQCISQGMKRICLHAVLSVDEGGLALLTRLEDGEIRLEEGAPELIAALQDYRQHAEHPGHFPGGLVIA